MAAVAAFFGLVAPCVIVALVIGHMLRSRASHKNRMHESWSSVLPVSQYTDKSVPVQTATPTLIDVAREILKQPVPVGAPLSSPALPTRTLSVRGVPVRPRATSSPSIDEELFRAFMKTRPRPQRRHTAPAVLLPRIIVTAPEEDKPWTPGWVVPKQNTSGTLLVVPGAPSRTVHYALRLP